GLKTGARPAMSWRSWNQIKSARARLFALLFPRFLNPPCPSSSGTSPKSGLSRWGAWYCDREFSIGRIEQNFFNLCLFRLSPPPVVEHSQGGLVPPRPAGKEQPAN